MDRDRTRLRHDYVIILYSAILLISYYDVISAAEVEYLDNYDSDALINFSEAVSMAMDMTIQGILSQSLCLFYEK